MWTLIFGFLTCRCFFPYPLLAFFRDSEFDYLLQFKNHELFHPPSVEFLSLLALLIGVIISMFLILSTIILRFLCGEWPENDLSPQIPLVKFIFLVIIQVLTSFKVCTPAQSSGKHMRDMPAMLFFEPVNTA